MKLGNKEKIMILFLVVILIVGVGYNYILKDMKVKVKELDATNKDLSAKLADWKDQFKNQTSIDRSLVIKKSEAINLSKMLISECSTASLYLQIAAIFEQSVILDDIQIGKYIEIPLIQLDEAGVPTESKNIKLKSAEFSIMYSCAAPTVINNLLINLENNYPFIIVSSYNIPSIKETTDPVNVFGGEMRGYILVTSGSLSGYDKEVFQCPHMVEGPNGTSILCGEWNDYKAKFCFKCRQALDFCPNLNCHTLLTGVESQCPVCEKDFIICNSCGKKALADDTICTKCGKNVTGSN